MQNQSTLWFMGCSGNFKTHRLTLYVSFTLYFTSKNYCGVMKRKLDHDFTSNIFHESVKKWWYITFFFLQSFSCFISIKRYCDFKRQKATGNSIADYYQRINLNRCENLNFYNIREFLKQEIRKLTKTLSKANYMRS